VRDFGESASGIDCGDQPPVFVKVEPAAYQEQLQVIPDAG
jgi:hypothetical protein